MNNSISLFEYMYPRVLKAHMDILSLCRVNNLEWTSEISTEHSAFYLKRYDISHPNIVINLALFNIITEQLGGGLLHVGRSGFLRARTMEPLPITVWRIPNDDYPVAALEHKESNRYTNTYVWFGVLRTNTKK